MSLGPLTAFPAAAVITSPGTSPAAAAGPPGTTPRIVAPSPAKEVCPRAGRPGTHGADATVADAFTETISLRSSLPSRSGLRAVARGGARRESLMRPCHSNHTARAVQQRPAGVSRLEGCVRLDEPGELFRPIVGLDRDRLVQPGHVAPRRRERARAAGIADRRDACAELEARGATGLSVFRCEAFCSCSTATSAVVS